jgi:uncharacterized protein (TIGR03435 family)
MPAWAYSERFDIVTTATPGAPVGQLQAMARRLLADRFALRTRLEQRPAEVYALVRVNPAGPLGPGMREAANGCRRSDPVTGAPVAFTAPNPCVEPTTRIDGGGIGFHFRDRPLNDVLIFTSARSEIGGPIVDRTGLVGRFDIDLEFESRTFRERNPNGLGVPLGVAFERQLGLRFERRTEPVDVLVVEHVAMPSLD